MIFDNDWPGIFDRNGNRITTEQFEELFEKPGYKIIQQDTVGDVLISTVWLGVNHNFNIVGPPLIFETMIFTRGDGNVYGRYATEDAALIGHQLATLFVVSW